MSQFEDLLNKFRSACGQLESLKEDLKQIPALTQMLEEVMVASEALNELKASFEAKVLSVDEHAASFEALKQEMESSEVYGPMAQGEQEQLADYLAKMNQPLATEEVILQSLERVLSEKASPELVSLLPIVQVRKAGMVEAQANELEIDESEAYPMGAKAYAACFEEDRAGAVALVLASMRLRGLTYLARNHYREVFK